MIEDVKPRALVLEDSDVDAELLHHALVRGGLDLEIRRAHDHDTYLTAMDEGGFEIILADYSLPNFDGLTALHLARERFPTVPFLFVSGVVGEEFATDAVKAGATDYVLKRNLMRLPAAVIRALAEARERQGRRRAEAALEEHDVRLRLAVSAGKLGTFDYVPALDEVIWTVGSQADGAPRRAHFDEFIAHVHADDRDTMRSLIQSATTDGGDGEFTSEFRLIDPAGRARWMATRAQSFFDQGVCTRFVGVVQDITDLKNAEQMLRQQNQLLAQEVQDRTRERDRIWQLSRDLMVVCDQQTRAIAVNPAWRSMLGWTEHDLVGQPLLDLFHSEDRYKLRRDRQRDLTGSFQVESRVRRKSGGFRWIAWTAVPQHDMLYAIGRDVTEQRVAVAEIAAANRQLKRQIEEREKVESTLQQMQRLEAVGQLTAGVAHDFNNLLTVVLGNVALLKRELDTGGIEPRLAKRLEQMGRAAERGAKLTTQLLAFSRRTRLEPKPVDLNDTIAGMRDLLQSTMGGSVVVTTELQTELWHALVDATQIELIVLNLAINSRDAMSSGGDLTVATSNVTLRGPPNRAEEPGAGDYVALSVKDTGSGMTEDVLQRAFEPFFTTKEVGKGSGLGLAQVFGFAKQSGGGVRVETEVGTGTTVHVLLPRAQSADEPTAIVHPEPVETPSERWHGTVILLVDDDAAVREVTARMLRDMGYDVREAGSGGAALDLLAREPRIALSVMDYAMPGMNGAEVAQEVHKRRPELPVLFITGYADLMALKGVGEDRIVQKPFHEADLASKIGRTLHEAYG
jgi:PAS domain S-box-containing protein